MTIGNDSYGATPGLRTARTSDERVVYVRGDGFKGIWATSSKIKIDSTNTDTGNTAFTNTLRAGNLISTEKASGNEYIYDPDATDGRQEAFGILEGGLSMLEDGVSTEKGPTPVLVRGIFKEQNLIGVDAQARAQLARQGIQMDDPGNGDSFLTHPRGVWRKAADYTVLASDNGRLFVSTDAGDIEFTLPSIAAGLSFEFLQLIDDEMLITSAEGDNIVLKNDPVASGISYTTDGDQIGARCRVLAIYTATSTLKWIVQELSAAAITVIA
jgi:hypothetical protein